MKDKYVKEKVEDHAVIDLETGDLTECYQLRKVSLDEFIMVFFSSYPDLYKLNGVQLKVLMQCWKCSTYNSVNCTEGNIVHNNPKFKECCRQDGLETSDANIDNAISTLCKKGLLIKRCKGKYLLDPRYFFKGKLSDRSRIQCTFIVEPTGE
jgi:hypothetical protein